MVRSTTVREAEFTPDEVASLLASRRAANARRGPHGYTIAEATDPANQFRFRPTKPVRDWAMVAMSQAQKLWYAEHPEDKGDSSLIWKVEKR
jgi:hypothetical protein